MLGGEFRYAIDSKGRVNVPAKLRDEMGGIVIVTKGIGEKCLFVYTSEGWKSIEEKISQLPLSDKNARFFVRFFVGGACECEIDKQGRINIPQYLRDYAMLDKNIVISGASTRLEIWDEKEWDSYTDLESQDCDAIFEQVAKLGFI